MGQLPGTSGSATRTAPATLNLPRVWVTFSAWQIRQPCEARTGDDHLLPLGAGMTGVPPGVVGAGTPRPPAGLAIGGGLAPSRPLPSASAAPPRPSGSGGSQSTTTPIATTDSKPAPHPSTLLQPGHGHASAVLAACLLPSLALASAGHY